MRGNPYLRSIVLFPFMSLFYWCAIYLYTPTLSAYATANGASAQMVGLIVGGYGLTQVLLRLPFGLLSDELRRRKVFVCIGMLFAALGALVAAVAPSAVGLFLARCLAGVGASAWVNCTVLYPAYFSAGHMSGAVSMLNASSSCGSSLSCLIGGKIVHHFGQTAAAYVAFGCGVLALLLSLLISDHRPEKKICLDRRTVYSVLRRRELWRFGAIATVFHFVWTGTTNCFTPLVAQKFQPTSSQLGYLAACGNFGILLASAVLGVWVLPRLSVRMLFQWGLAALGVLMMLTVWVGNYWILLLLLLLQGMIGYSVFLGALIQGMRIFPDEERGIAMGLVQAVYAGGQFLGPLLMGQAVGHVSFQIAYGLICALCLLMALLAHRWMRRCEVSAADGKWQSA